MVRINILVHLLNNNHEVNQKEMQNFIIRNDMFDMLKVLYIKNERYIFK